MGGLNAFVRTDVMQTFLNMHLSPNRGFLLNYLSLTFHACRHTTDKCHVSKSPTPSLSLQFSVFLFTKATGTHKNECFSLSWRLAHFKRTNLFDPHMKEPALGPTHGNNGRKKTKTALLRGCEMLTRELNVNISRVKEDIKHSVSEMRFGSVSKTRALRDETVVAQVSEVLFQM